MLGRRRERVRVHRPEPGLEIGDNRIQVGFREGPEAFGLLGDDALGIRLRNRLDPDHAAATGLRGILRALQVAHLRIGDGDARVVADVRVGALPPLVGEFGPVGLRAIELRPLEDHGLAARLEEVEAELARLAPKGGRRRIVENRLRKVLPAARRMARDDFPEARLDARRVQPRKVGVDGLDHRVRHGVQDEVHVRVRTDDAGVEVLAHEVENGPLKPLTGDLAGPACRLDAGGLRPSLADLREEVDVVPLEERPPVGLVLSRNAGGQRGVVRPRPPVIVTHENDGRGRLVKRSGKPDGLVVVVDELLREDRRAARAPLRRPVDEGDGPLADVGEAVVRELAARRLADVRLLAAKHPLDVVPEAGHGNDFADVRREGPKFAAFTDERLDLLPHGRLPRALEEMEERGRGEADGHAAVAREGHAEGVLADPDRGVLERRRRPGGGRERIEGDGLRVLERGVDSRGHGSFSFFLA